MEGFFFILVFKDGVYGPVGYTCMDLLVISDGQCNMTKTCNVVYHRHKVVCLTPSKEGGEAIVYSPLVNRQPMRTPLIMSLQKTNGRRES